MNTAVAESTNYSLREPRPLYCSSTSRNKQITRIIVHLRDQIRQSCSQLPMPTQWMIGALVDNATKNSEIDSDQQHDWQAELNTVLKNINQACDVGLDKTCPYVLKDNITPLFPNHELFDEWDAYRFSLALLNYLDSL